MMSRRIWCPIILLGGVFEQSIKILLIQSDSFRVGIKLFRKLMIFIGFFMISYPVIAYAQLNIGDKAVAFLLNKGAGVFAVFAF